MVLIILIFTFINTSKVFSTEPEVVSLNMHFTYEKFVPNLSGTIYDIELSSSIAEALAFKVIKINDKNLQGNISPKEKKEKLLQNMISSVKSFQTINLNYSGHGIVHPNDSFAILLPTFRSHTEFRFCTKALSPAIDNTKLSIEIHCDSENARGDQLIKRGNAKLYDYENVRRSCEELKKDFETSNVSSFLDYCDQFLLTSKDLKKVFRNKKVFGFVDSCHSRKLALSLEEINFELITSSDESLPSIPCGRKGNGALFLFLQDIKESEELKCLVDQNMDGVITLREIGAVIKIHRKAYESQNKKLNGDDATSSALNSPFRISKEMRMTYKPYNYNLSILGADYCTSKKCEQNKTVIFEYNSSACEKIWLNKSAYGTEKTLKSISEEEPMIIQFPFCLIEK